jgi:hypothetical protein
MDTDTHRNLSAASTRHDHDARKIAPKTVQNIAFHCIAPKPNDNRPFQITHFNIKCYLL